MLDDGVAPDSFRYFCVKDASPGADVKFSRPALVLAHNTELADAFGNLLHRATALASSKCDGQVPAPVNVEVGKPFDLASLRNDATKAMASLDVGAYAKRVMACCRDANKWVADLEPWKMKDDSADKRQEVLRLLLEACYALSLFLAPLSTKRGDVRTAPSRRSTHGNIKTQSGLLEPADGSRVTPGAPLFAQIEVDGGASAALAKEKKKKVVSKKPEAFVDYTDGDDTAASRLALVVGKIVDVWPHPDSDKLFCEKIDCGEAFGPACGKSRSSGLQKHYKVDDLKGPAGGLGRGEPQGQEAGRLPVARHGALRDGAGRLAVLRRPSKIRQAGRRRRARRPQEPARVGVPGRQEEALRQGAAALRRPRQRVLLQGQAVRYKRGAVHGGGRGRGVD